MTMPPPNRPPPVVAHRDLVLGRIVAEHRGESRLVCLLDSHPGLLYKEYKSAMTAAAAARLDRLVGFPAGLGRTERDLIDANTSWPAARVEKGRESWGVLLPEAPAAYRADMRLLGGRISSETLIVDHLAQPAPTQQSRGIRPPSLAERVAVCSSLTGVAALFERYGLVYLDWSLENAFWSQHDHTAFVIDVDGCTFGPRQMIGTEGWEDPLTPRGTDGGTTVDRYRVALLVARCLTASRPDTNAEHAVVALASVGAAHPELDVVCGLVTRAVRAQRPADRPRVALLAGALTRAERDLRPGTYPRTGGGRVKGWRPIGPAVPEPETGGHARGGSPGAGDLQPALGPYVHAGPPDAASRAGASWNETGGAAVVMVLLALVALAFFVIIVL